MAGRFTAVTLSLLAASAACAGQGGVWNPDLVKSQAVIGAGVLVKF